DVCSSDYQPLELGKRGLEVAALRLELLDVLHGLLVLPLGQRVDRTKLLAAPGKPLHARLQIAAGVLVEHLLAGRGIEPEPRGDPLQLRGLLRRSVARL